MTNPTEQFAAWNQAAYDSALSYARASLASAEQLLQAQPGSRAQRRSNRPASATRDLLSVSDPQQFVQARTKLAQDNMQQAATYAQSVYEIVSQTQRELTKLFEEQISRVSKDMTAGAETSRQGRTGRRASRRRSSRRSRRPRR